MNNLAVPTRPDWNEYFMAIADVVASRSTCLRRQVGALIVRDNRILSTGYNGAPTGARHCLEEGCLRDQRGIPSGERHELCRGLHAEQNAILQAALHGVSVAGGVFYVTLQPCALCAKMIANLNVSEVVYRGAYADQLALDTLREAKVQLTHCENTEKTL